MPRQDITSPELLADAVIGVVADHGLDAVTIRTVAQRAGVAIGTVQHHFRTKDALLLGAYERVIERAWTRLQPTIELVETNPADAVRAILAELLPLDEQRTAGARVALAFSARSMHAARLAELYEESYGVLLDLLRRSLRAARAADAAAVASNFDYDAVCLAGLADGLAWHMLCAPGVLDATAAQAVLDRHVAQILSG